MQKYPRTPHIEGSNLQDGDHDLTQVPFLEIRGKPVIIEEKLDGSQAAISFWGQDHMVLQSRGHVLHGGPRERHFTVFKAWAPCHQSALWNVLGDRYIMFGEWMQGKHTEFYDNLPHYFMEFDIFDKKTETFLSTPRRHEMLQELPVVSVPVLWAGIATTYDHLLSLIKISLYKTENWELALKQATLAVRYDFEKVKKETDMSRMSEGLYIKVEEAGEVVQRLKFVRHGFIQAIFDSDTHWMERPLIENTLASGVDIWAATVTVGK
jgi:hypothetical protein